MELGYVSSRDKILELNLWVTLECNFACKYCYENGVKKSSFLDKEKADEIIEFVQNRCKEEMIDALWINFHGGEPMLNATIIKYIVDTIREKDFVKKMFTSMTTNCYTYDSSILDYICELTVSIDGTKSAHDRNRVMKNGKGTYDIAIKNALKYLHNRNDVRLRTVVTSNNVGELYEGVKQLVDYGFKTIVPGPDYFDTEWKDEDFDTYYEQVKKIEQYINDNQLREVAISALSQPFIKKKPCHVGCDGFQIDSEGYIYPCSYVVGKKEYCIGDVKNGLDDEKINEINSIGKEIVEACEGCSHYNYCETPRCFLLNKQLTGDYYTPSPVVCAYENLLLRVRGLL